MVEIMPSDGPGRDAYWKREMERRMGNVERARNTQFTKIYDEDGNLLGSLSAAGLEFFNANGNRISSLDGDGLSVYDDDGVAQLRAGDLDGAGDYGVEIGGGRARAIEMRTYYSDAFDVHLTSTPQPVVSVNVEPPDWATGAHVFAWLIFQMGNYRGELHRQRYRIDIDGQPGGVGYWNNDVPIDSFANVTDVQRVSVFAPLSTIVAEGIAGVDVGTNDDNSLRLIVFAWFTR